MSQQQTESPTILKGVSENLDQQRTEKQKCEYFILLSTLKVKTCILHNLNMSKICIASSVQFCTVIIDSVD